MKTYREMRPLKLIFISVILIFTGSMLLKYGVSQIGGITLSNLGSSAMLVLTNVPLLIGFMMYILSSLTWMLAISRSDLSKAYPILASAYAIVPVLSWIIFDDAISILRWAGIATVCIGVILMSRS